MIRFTSIALALSLFSAPVFAAPVKYVFDKSHSNLSFTFNHFNYSIVDGRFADWNATLMIDADKPSDSSVDFVIKAKSLDTFWPKRNEHLKSADFFDVAKYPLVTFKSTSVEKDAENHLQVKGNLTIKGITKPAVLEVRVLSFGMHPMDKKQAAGFLATAIVKRSDYGMGAYVPYVGDEIHVRFSGEATVAK